MILCSISIKMTRCSIALCFFFTLILHCRCNDPNIVPSCDPPSGPPNPHGNNPSSKPPPNGEPPSGKPPSGNPSNKPPSSEPSGNPPGHHGITNTNGKTTVVISFDSLDNNSMHFFVGQVQKVFKDFNSCVNWEFIPCSTSHIVDDVLHCKDGPKECKIDVLHACAAHFYGNEQEKLGNFFICMMTKQNQYAQGENCAKHAGMDWAKLEKCQPSKDAWKFCDNRWKQLNELGECIIPGVMYNFKKNEQADKASIDDLKSGICNQLKKDNHQCPACGGGGGGGGGGGENPPGGKPPGGKGGPEGKGPEGKGPPNGHGSTNGPPNGPPNGPGAPC